MFGSIGSISSGSTAPVRQPGPDTVASESRALTVVTPPTPTEASPTNYRPAVFLAHLLATRDQAPQWRTRRRSRPDEAIAAYTAAAARPVRKGAAFSREF
jgi:hypothetical protein